MVEGWQHDPLGLPPDVAAVAAEQLNESPEVRVAALAELRQKIEEIAEDSVRKPTRTDDAYLVLFLRHAKFRVERALEKVCNMAAFLREHEELLRDLRAEEFRELYGCGMLRVLRGRAHSGARINTLVPAAMEAYKGEDDFFVKSLRFSVWSFHRMAADPYLQVHGVVMLEDFKDFSFLGAMKMASRGASRMRNASMRFLQECAPFRVQGIVIANEPVFFDFLWALVKPFMRPKLRSRVQMLGSDTSGFLGVAPAEELPRRFGGTCDDDGSAWLEEMVRAEAAGEAATGLRL